MNENLRQAKFLVIPSESGVSNSSKHFILELLWTE